MARPRRGVRGAEAALMTYTAVLFDLFDTLVRFDRDRMPEIQVNGRTVRSTAGPLHRVLRSPAPEISLEACYEALVESWREAERLRAIDYREVPAPERFDHFFRRLALDPARLPPGLGQTLIDTHRSQLGKAAEFPLHHGPLLERLARRYRLEGKLGGLPELGDRKSTRLNSSH